MRNHYVPQFLLRAWADQTPDGKVESFRLDLHHVPSARHTPRHVGFEHDLYPPLYAADNAGFAIGSHLAAIAFVVKSRSRAKYLRLFREALNRTDGYKFLEQIYLPLEQLDAQITILSNALKVKAATLPTSKLLMTIPGVGPFTALRFISLVDVPSRFKTSRSVGAYIGLTARVYQSGGVTKRGGLTRRGSTELRRSLFMGAQVLLTQSKMNDRLRNWALGVAHRRRKKSAIVALARKLAVVMHAVWISGQPYKDRQEAAA